MDRNKWLEDSKILFHIILFYSYLTGNFDMKSMHLSISAHVDDLISEFQNIYTENDFGNGVSDFTKYINFISVREQIIFDIELLNRIVITHAQFISETTPLVENELYELVSKNLFGETLSSDDSVEWEHIVRQGLMKEFSYSDIQAETVISSFKSYLIDYLTDRLPSNIGSIIAGVESASDKKTIEFLNRYKKYIPLLYIDGVKFNNIILWWMQDDVNRHMVYYLERKKMMDYILTRNKISYDIDDGVSMMRLINSFKEKNPNKYVKDIKDYHIASPIFYAFEFEQDWILKNIVNNADRPLPVELYDRVQKYFANIGGEEIVHQLAMKTDCKSINAFIRMKVLRNEL